MYDLLDIKSPLDEVFWCLFLFAFFLMARKSNLVPKSTRRFDDDLVGTNNVNLCQLVEFEYYYNVLISVVKRYVNPSTKIILSAIIPR